MTGDLTPSPDVAVLDELIGYATSHAALKAGRGNVDDVIGFVDWYRRSRPDAAPLVGGEPWRTTVYRFGVQTPAQADALIAAIDRELAEARRAPALPVRCPCPDHVGPEDAHPVPALPVEALRQAITDAINDAPGMHVAEYGDSMVGRQHAIDVAVEAVARLRSEPSR